jgi:hypothetical protein
MSKHNKANKSNYIQAGRLTPDDMARERQRQGTPRVDPERERVKGYQPNRGAPESTDRQSEPEESA